MKPIVIAAGGTGGHFFPAEALAAELLQRGHRVVLMTDARSGAAKNPVFAGLECHVLAGAGIAGRGALRAGRAVVALGVGVLQARRILAGLDAACVVGFGGYPCVAPIVAAATLHRRPKLVLHEQNAVLGRANRFLARFADRLALGFAITSRVPPARKTVFTGNPVRPAVAALHGTPYVPPTDAIRILVLGGSLGARVFSDVVPDALAALPEPIRARLQITQQCRDEDILRTREDYAKAGIAADLARFFQGVEEKYAACHMIVARAGASTCAEIAVVGRPAILVPLPSAIDGHQMANARALADAGAATVLRQEDFTAAALTAILAEKLTQPETLARQAEAAAACATPRAAADLADAIETLVTGVESVP